MKLRTVVYTLLLATLCMGCGGHGHMRQLERLEAQLDTAPELVRLALDSIPLATLDGEARALYAILRTQADYKCYVPLTTDTLIRYATDYYNRNKKSYRAAMAWYSLGCVYTELEDDVNAIYAYLQAKSYFPDTTTKYHAYCNQNLGTHYLNRNMFDEALTSLDAFDKVAISESYDKEIRAASRLEVARIYMHKGLSEIAEATLKDALHDSLSIGTRAQILFELGKIEYLFYSNNEKAETIFDSCIVISGDENSSTAYFFKAEIAEKKKNKQQARNYYQMAMQDKNDLFLQYNCIRNLMYLSMDSPQYSLQHAYVRQYEVLNDSIVKAQKQTEVQEIKNAHVIELKEQELKEQKRQIVVWCVVCFIVLVCAIVVVSLLIERRRRAYIKHLQDTLLRNQAELHRLRISTVEENIDQELVESSAVGVEEEMTPPVSPANRIAILAIYKNNIDTSNALFRRDGWSTLLDKRELVEEKDCMFSLFEREQLRETLFNCFSTVVSNLYDEAPSLNDKEVLHCLLSALNYGPYIIKACLVSSSLNVVRMQKSRIKKKLPVDIYPLFFSS